MKVALLLLGAALVAGGVGLWYRLGVRGNPRTRQQPGWETSLALPFPEEQILEIVRRELDSRRAGGPPSGNRLIPNPKPDGNPA